MKNTAIVIAILALAAGKLNAAATATGRAITGSAHDFTSTREGSASGYVGNGGTYLVANRCTTCHAPHNAIRNVPLWGRPTPTNSNWVVWNDKNGATDNPGLKYTNPDGTAMTGQALSATDGSGEDINLGGGKTVKEYLSGSALMQTGTGLCMSCHDGSTAINQVIDPDGDDTAPGVAAYLNAGGNITMNSGFRGNWGRDLRNMHPVGKYVPFGVDDGFKTALDNSGNNVVLEGPAGDRVGCTSCHSMHSSELDSMKILRKGQICLACHDR